MIDFTPIFDLLEKAMHLDENEAWFFVMDPETVDHIIQMNTEDQLEYGGIFSDGSPTPDYSPYTKILKREKGQRADHMTFRDTGEFYNSFVVQVDQGGFTIDANGQVSSDTNLFQFYGENIAGLTDENTGFLVDIITEKYIEYIYNEIGVSK